MTKHEAQDVLLITRDELAEALRSVRLWVRFGDSAEVAYRLKVVSPEDAAEDIFTRAHRDLTRNG